jgi:hypothetical protein
MIVIDTFDTEILLADGTLALLRSPHQVQVRLRHRELIERLGQSSKSLLIRATSHCLPKVSLPTTRLAPITIAGGVATVPVKLTDGFRLLATITASDLGHVQPIGKRRGLPVRAALTFSVGLSGRDQNVISIRPRLSSTPKPRRSRPRIPTFHSRQAMGLSVVRS